MIIIWAMGRSSSTPPALVVDDVRLMLADLRIFLLFGGRDSHASRTVAARYLAMWLNAALNIFPDVSLPGPAPRNQYCEAPDVVLMVVQSLSGGYLPARQRDALNRIVNITSGARMKLVELMMHGEDRGEAPQQLRQPRP